MILSFFRQCNYKCTKETSVRDGDTSQCASNLVSTKQNLSGVSICTSPNLDILGLRFAGRLAFEDHVRGIVYRVSQRIGILRLVKRVFVDISVLLRCYSAFVLPILEYCSPVWGSDTECHFQFSRPPDVARLCPDQTFLSLCHRRHVSALCMLY